MSNIILEENANDSEKVGEEEKQKRKQKSTAVFPAKSTTQAAKSFGEKPTLANIVSVPKVLRTSLVHKLSSMYIAPGVQILLICQAPISAQSFL